MRRVTFTPGAVNWFWANERLEILEHGLPEEEIVQWCGQPGYELAWSHPTVYVWRSG